MDITLNLRVPMMINSDKDPGNYETFLTLGYSTKTIGNAIMGKMAGNEDKGK